MNTSDFTTKDIERFWSKVNRTDDPDSCWEWKGSVTKRGYGQFKVGSRKEGTRANLSIHRVAYCLIFGNIPEKTLICHTCDNRKCANPRHLYLGTYTDNNRDTVRRNRHVSYRGEENKSSKLTISIVKAIRYKYQ